MAFGNESAFHFEGEGYGMSADLVIESAAEECGELEAEEATFGKHGSVAFDKGAKMGKEFGTAGDHGFAEEGATFCASDIEDVAEGGDVAQGHIAAFGIETVGETGTVDEEGDVAVGAHFIKGLELTAIVDGAEFGGEGDVDGAGSNHGIVAVVGIETVDISGYVGRFETAVMAGERDDFVAPGLDSSGLMHVDMARIGAENTLIITKQGIDYGAVGLRAALEEKGLSAVYTAKAQYEFAGRGAIRVVAVAGGVLKIGAHERFHYSGVTACHIVAVEVYHG